MEGPQNEKSLQWRAEVITSILARLPLTEVLGPIADRWRWGRSDCNCILRVGTLDPDIWIGHSRYMHSIATSIFCLIKELIGFF